MNKNSNFFYMLLLCQSEVILDDIFKKNIGKMNEVAKLFEKILRKKEEWKYEEEE